MFCTSLRRRASCAAGIASLTSSFGLRENNLLTHDLEIPFGSSIAERDGHNISARHLRVLLLAPSAVRDAEINGTLERVEHFTSLTGGQDVIVVFLLYPPQLPSFVTANQLHSGTAHDSTNADGIFAYSKLQAEMFNHTSIPPVPLLPLGKLDGLATLLQRYITDLTRSFPKQKPEATSFELLQLCTASPPVSQHTAFILSDLFTDLRDLATTCTAITSVPHSSSPAAMAASSYLSAPSDPAVIGPSSQPLSAAPENKLTRLRDLVGEHEYRDIVDFWKEEWMID